MSFRLGRHDGVSVVAATWARVLAAQGWTVRTVAGDGPVDHLLPGLAVGARTPPTASEIDAALDGVDLVVVENLCTIPLNLPAARAVAGRLRGRPAVLHHHDPPWQRAQWAHVTELPPRDPAWRHVTINRLTEGEMADAGHRGDHDLQRLRRRRASRRPRRDPRGARRGRRRAAARAPRAGDRTQGSPRRARAGRGPRRDVLARRTRRGRLRRHAGRAPRRRVGARASTARRPARWPTPTPPATRWPSRPRGRGSATHRSRRRSTGDPSRWARTRWPTSSAALGFRWFDPAPARRARRVPPRSRSGPARPQRRLRP